MVDLETTSLDYDTAVPVEVALLNVDTGESLRFVPHVTLRQLGEADQTAMEINGYYERAVWREALDEKRTAAAWSDVRDWLRGNTFAGSNPAFDSTVVARQLAEDGLPVGRVWHHRLADVAAYAAGKLDLQPTELPGLDRVAERLAVPVIERHSAIGDAFATGLIFDTLRSMKGAHL
ncbi:DnaE-like DNA polymerase III [Mycobacterium phage Mdavu]|nr:DnaE-like DNA polymerase III [Mycobacterium phage SgtBeansprout]QGJ93334.1 DnaE-like DNA polymerase III [Mycobacterium phage Mdavu]UXE03212.1 DnaE-like DNA polymerase III alpha [Mycobacterium phage Nikao]